MRIRARRVAILAGLAVALVVVAVALTIHARHASVPLGRVGLRQDLAPRKQLPIANVKIWATEGGRSAEGVSDTSGLFRLKLPNGGWREQPVSLTFGHPGYEPVENASRM